MSHVITGINLICMDRSQAFEQYCPVLVLIALSKAVLIISGFIHQSKPLSTSCLPVVLFQVLCEVVPS